MPFPSVFQRGFNSANATEYIAGLGNSFANSSLLAQTSASLVYHGKRVMDYVNSSPDLFPRLVKSISKSSLPAQASAIVRSYGKRVIELFKQPLIRKLMLTYGVTFLGVLIFSSCLGFGSIGVGGGTLAAMFQSIVYGGLVPAGSLFANLTSMGMLGTLLPAAAGVAAIVATCVTMLTWVRGEGN